MCHCKPIDSRRKTRVLLFSSISPGEKFFDFLLSSLYMFENNEHERKIASLLILFILFSIPFTLISNIGYNFHCRHAYAGIEKLSFTHKIDLIKSASCLPAISPACESGCDALPSPLLYSSTEYTPISAAAASIASLILFPI